MNHRDKHDIGILVGFLPAEASVGVPDDAEMQHVPRHVRQMDRQAADLTPPKHVTWWARGLATVRGTASEIRKRHLSPASCFHSLRGEERRSRDYRGSEWTCREQQKWHDGNEVHMTGGWKCLSAPFAVCMCIMLVPNGLYYIVTEKKKLCSNWRVTQQIANSNILKSTVLLYRNRLSLQAG